MSSMRRAKLAGSWYADDPTVLGRSLDRFVNEAEKLPYTARGAVLPHAGHTFSGRGIAPFFKNCDPALRHIVILAPSHYTLLPEARIGYGDFASFATPLGDIPGITGLFTGREPFTEMNPAAEAEHSAEMFLPFIKRFLPAAAVALLLIPHLADQTAMRRFADAIMGALSSFNPAATAFIASSDFTHYGDRFGYTPFTGSLDGVLARVATNDRKYAGYIARHEYAEAFADRDREEPSICGINPALVLSRLMELRQLRGETAGYYTSCDIVGKSDDFVCYATILFHG